MQHSGTWVCIPDHDHDPDHADKIPPLLTEFCEHNTGSSSPETTWDAFKAYTRGHYISSIAAIKKEQQATTLSLQQLVSDCTMSYNSDLLIGLIFCRLLRETCNSICQRLLDFRNTKIRNVPLNWEIGMAAY